MLLFLTRFRLVFAGFGLFSGLALSEVALAQIEEPAFKLVAKDGAFEVRDYAPMIVAEVAVEGERDSAVNSGFRILAGYIFGANTAQSKIAMTAPVTQSTGETIAMTAPVTQTSAGNSWLIRFSMPASFTLETLPKPNDERILIKKLPGRQVAVLGFSGLWTEGNLTQHREELAGILKQKGLKPKGSATFAFYDPPWKPFFWRRNEILQEIEKH